MPKTSNKKNTGKKSETAKKKVEKNSVKKVQIVGNIRKRGGKVVKFDVDKISRAIHKAMITVSEGSKEEAVLVANKVHAELVKIKKTFDDFRPSVEGVQDIVEQQLILSNYVKTAKHYILYREERSKIRAQRAVEIPEKVRKLAEQSKKYFRNPLAEFVYYRTYSKWIEAEGRRETWIETVDRYIGFMKDNLGSKLKPSEYAEVREAILKHEAMPSMRLMQFAGPAAARTNVCAYNCSYTAPECVRDLAEVMYISMCGTGAGFAVESINVQKFPQIIPQTGKKMPVHVVEDSKEGWCEAFYEGAKTWFEGKDIDFDFSLIRPEGSRLKIMGGKASGPEPLKQLMEFTKKKILSKQGRRLTNIDVHDVTCMIAQIVVVGGVRRSAMISLSDLDDLEMRDAKNGQFWVTAPQRSMANNSAVYTEKPSTSDFMKEWLALVESQSGERGIFNRSALKSQLPARRFEVVSPDTAFGTNPCGEIILQPKQFCNLSECVCRREDTEKDLMKKVRIATILGTYQSSLTNFEFLSKEWKERCDAEALLGVSLTGQWDSEVVRDPKVLDKLRKESIRVNKIYAKRFGIHPSTCITTTKPSGTVSQVVDSSSGMHPRHAAYYIRRVRIGKTDALFKMIKDQGVPYKPEVGFTEDTASTFVIEFPVKAPAKAVTKNDITALDQLAHWKMVKTHYTEHNPSVTISVGPDEWLKVGNWVYENWDIVGGLSFLPRTDHVYQLAPYEEINKEQYDMMISKVENIDFSKILVYEKTDESDMKRELACSAGVCEVDDILVNKVEK